MHPSFLPTGPRPTSSPLLKPITHLFGQDNRMVPGDHDWGNRQCTTRIALLLRFWTKNGMIILASPKHAKTSWATLCLKRSSCLGITYHPVPKLNKVRLKSCLTILTLGTPVFKIYGNLVLEFCMLSHLNHEKHTTQSTFHRLASKGIPTKGNHLTRSEPCKLIFASPKAEKKTPASLHGILVAS